MKINKTYYLYRHIRLDKNEPFYIGIGTCLFNENKDTLNNRYLRAFKCSTRSEFWKNIKSKTEIRVDIMFESENLKEIQDKEIFFISLYGRKDLGLGTLVNLTDGGELNKGSIPTKEHMQKASFASLAKFAKTYFKYDLNGNLIETLSFKDEKTRNLYSQSDKKKINACSNNTLKDKYDTHRNHIYSFDELTVEKVIYLVSKKFSRKKTV